MELRQKFVLRVKYHSKYYALDISYIFVNYAHSLHFSMLFSKPPNSIKLFSILPPINVLNFAIYSLERRS